MEQKADKGIIRRLAGKINPETGKPYSLEEIGRKAGGITRERVRQILEAERIEKPHSARIPPDRVNAARKLSEATDLLTGRAEHSLRKIKEQTGVSDLGRPKGSPRKPNPLFPKTYEIIRLGSSHDIKTMKPVYSHKEIAERLGTSQPYVSATLKRYGVKRIFQSPSGPRIRPIKRKPKTVASVIRLHEHKLK